MLCDIKKQSKQPGKILACCHASSHLSLMELYMSVQKLTDEASSVGPPDGPSLATGGQLGILIHLA